MLKEMGSSVLSILKKIEDKGKLSGMHQVKLGQLQIDYDDLKEDEPEPTRKKK